VISNVRGPGTPLYAAGVRLTAAYPHGPLMDGAGMNITVVSYGDSIDFGIIASERSVPHVADTALGFGAAVADLFKIALDERSETGSVDRVASDVGSRFAVRAGELGSGNVLRTPRISAPRRSKSREERRIPAMSIQSLRRTVSCRFLIALLALSSWSEIAAAQDESAGAAPLNAHVKRYGDGWECDRGYRDFRRSCVAVEVPANAHLDSWGHGWKCSRGYRKTNQACAKIEVPPHAFLSSSGSRWECGRGYRRADQSCEAISLPANAYLDSSGNRWNCDRGFRRSGDSCAALEIPEDGHLGPSGNDWECKRGYLKRDRSCVAVEVPPNGYLDSSGHAWDCERGFKKGLRSCLAFQVPMNAHLDYSGNRWTCDAGYRRRGETCTEDEG